MACKPIRAGFGFPLLRAARSGAESEGRTPNTMPDAGTIALTTPQIDDLGLARIVNRRGLSISRLPNGAIFSLEHRQDDRRRIRDQPGAGVADRRRAGAASLAHRRRIRQRSCRASAPRRIAASAPPTTASFGAASEQRRRLPGRRSGSTPTPNVWLWRRRKSSIGASEHSLATLVFVQDLGLGDASFVMNNEAYACQYLDHFVAAPSAAPAAS